jgi:Cdc6-like AAA superfamily ATPase
MNGMNGMHDVSGALEDLKLDDVDANQMSFIQSHNIIRAYKGAFLEQQSGCRGTVNISENFETLKRAINNTFEKRINTYLLLLGNKGFGKQHAIQWAIENSDYAKEIVYIPIESVIFNKEKKLLHEIQTQIQEKTATCHHSHEKNIYSRLMEYFGEKKIVLYIKNAEIFASEKRQVFLYTL